MSDQLQPHEYRDIDGKLHIQGEKDRTRRTNKVDVPFFNPELQMLGHELKVTPKTIKVMVRRTTASKDTRTNSAQKLLPSIDLLTYNVKAVVKLRRQLETEVYAFNNPPCIGIKHVEG